MRSPAVLAIALLALTAAAGLASAEPRELGDVDGTVPRLAIGGGFVLTYSFRGVRVHKGGRSASLPTSGWHFHVTADRDAVTLSSMPHCHDIVVRFTHAQLEARLDNAQGLARMKAGKLDGAAALFASALAHDPDLDLARRNHAGALGRLGRVDEAAATIAPLLARDPADTYARIVRDPDLAALRPHPSVLALRSTTPGTARIEPTRAMSGIGIAINPRGWIANVEVEGNHGACFDETRLIIRDGATLDVISTVLIATARDYYGDGCPGDGLTAAGRRAIARRAEGANHVLAELGFDVPATAELGALVPRDEDPGRGNIHRFRFAGHLGVVLAANGAVRVYRDGEPVTERPPGTAIVDEGNFDTSARAIYLRDQRRILIETFDFGCEWSEINGLVSISLP